MLLAAWVGCQPGGPARMQLRGDVSYNGEAIADGTVSFIPHDKDAGPPITGVIQNGAYAIPAEEGPTIGSYRVEIEGFRKTGKQIPDMITPLAPGQSRGVIDEKQPYIPTKFNLESTLTAEINAETKELDFNLNP
jgi:hypothetical protein